MISINDWRSMSNAHKTIWLESNRVINGVGSPRGMVYSVGINDAAYLTKPRLDGNQISCPAYDVWSGLLERCYDKKFKERCPTYSCVTVCDEWHSFSEFRKWWLEHQVDGFDIDKDIIGDGSVYSRESCIFIPHWLNSFTINCGSARGAWPIGVSYHKRDGCFQAKCSNPITGSQGYIGYFDTPEKAHAAWRTRKLELALELKPRMDEVDIRIYPRVVEMVRKAT